MKQFLSILLLLGIAGIFSGCQKEFSIEGGVVTGGGNTNSGTSVGTLGGSPGACANALVSGIYGQGMSLTDSTNFLTVQVTITKAGSYTIGTDTVNGVYFRKSGTFTDSGIQYVTLRAFGTPSNPGFFTNTVKYKGSFCSFEVEVFAQAVVNGTDYFPTTANSNWTYKDAFSTDTFRVTSTGATRNFAGNTYVPFTYNDGIIVDSLFYRKTPGLYYEYGQDLGGTGVSLEYIFLKDNVPVNTQWESAEVIIALPPGKAKVRSTILEKNVTKLVNGKVYANTIVVKREVLFALIGLPYTVAFQGEYWFAKGIGEINQIDLNSTFITKLIRHKVF